MQELQTKIETLEKKIAECQSQIKFKESETQIVDNLYKIFVHLYVILRDEYDTNQIYQISDKNQFKVLSPTQDMKMFKQNGQKFSTTIISQVFQLIREFLLHLAVTVTTVL